MFPESLRLIPDWHCYFAFIRSSWQECCLEICLTRLGGFKLSNCTAWNWRSVRWICGPSCGHGRGTPSVGLPWSCQTVSPAMPRTNCQCLAQLWLLWVVGHPLLLSLERCTCRVTFTAIIWAAGTIGSWLSTPVFIWDSWGDGCKKCLLQSLGRWIRSLWRNSLSRGWREQRIVTGWCHILVFVVPLSPESCPCRHCLMSWATLCVWPLIMVYLNETGRRTGGDS